MADSIDLVDLALIRYLQDHPRAPYSLISRETGVGESTVRRRIEQLTESRMITNAVIPNVYRLGYRTRATIALRVELSQVKAVAEALRILPEVGFVSITTGRWDLTCFVILQSLEALTDFMVNRIAPIPGIKDSETLITPHVVKVFADWRVPLEQAFQQHDYASEDGTMTSPRLWLPHEDEY